MARIYKSNEQEKNKELLALVADRAINIDYLDNFNEIILAEYEKFTSDPVISLKSYKNKALQEYRLKNKYKLKYDYANMSEQEICSIFDNALKSLSQLAVS